MGSVCLPVRAVPDGIQDQDPWYLPVTNNLYVGARVFYLPATTVTDALFGPSWLISAALAESILATVTIWLFFHELPRLIMRMRRVRTCVFVARIHSTRVGAVV